MYVPDVLKSLLRQVVTLTYGDRLEVMVMTSCPLSVSFYLYPTPKHRDCATT